MNNARARSGPADADPEQAGAPVGTGDPSRRPTWPAWPSWPRRSAIAYWPNFQDLYRTWDREPDYSHGFLVLPIALVILYRLWPSDGPPRPGPWLPGLLLVVVGLGLRAWFHERGQTWSETATVLIVVFGLGLARIGWPDHASGLAGVRVPPVLDAAAPFDQLDALAAAAECGDQGEPASFSGRPVCG